MKIDEKKIRAEFGSVKAFCDKRQVGINQFNLIKYKKTDIFHAASKAFQLYQLLKREGYIIYEP